MKTSPWTKSQFKTSVRDLSGRFNTGKIEKLRCFTDFLPENDRLFFTFGLLDAFDGLIPGNQKELDACLFVGNSEDDIGKGLRFPFGAMRAHEVPFIRRDIRLCSGGRNGYPDVGSLDDIDLPYPKVTGNRYIVGIDQVHSGRQVTPPGKWQAGKEIAIEVTFEEVTMIMEGDRVGRLGVQPFCQGGIVDDIARERIPAAGNRQHHHEENGDQRDGWRILHLVRGYIFKDPVARHGTGDMRDHFL